MIFNRHSRPSLRGTLLAIAVSTITISVASSAAVYFFTLSIALSCIAGWIVGLTSFVVLVLLLTRRLHLSLEAVEQGLINLLDNDYSISLVNSPITEVNNLIAHYNRLTESLRRERQTLYQRELLLDTIIDNAAMCVLIADQHHRIIFANRTADLQLNGNQGVKGMTLNAVLGDRNPELITAIRNQKAGIFSLHQERQDLHHLFTGQFELNAQQHTLILLKEMTRELNRQEAATWKKVIRIVSHELNNSLAAISSLAHSGALLTAKGNQAELPDIFNTLSERAHHLKDFVSRYATIAKLPTPQKCNVNWQDFYAGLNLGYPFHLLGGLPTRLGYFDPAQIQQLLLNLLKNAAESGSPIDEIHLRLTQTSDATEVEVTDRGTGIPPEIMQNALLPFYSTKTEGSGVGLPLCREIVDAHEGELLLSNRRGGGLRVKVILPGQYTRSD